MQNLLYKRPLALLVCKSKYSKTTCRQTGAVENPLKAYRNVCMLHMQLGDTPRGLDDREESVIMQG